MTRRYDQLKRVLDVIVGGAAMMMTLPVQAAVGVAIRRTMGSPVLFRQPRPGKGGEIFELVKFRTMRVPDVEHVTDAERLTPFGRWLRSTSLDELPTLWNVVKGEMSLVGPRPLLVEYLPLYNAEQARRHEVRPGITGLAQVSGRNAISWDEKFALDVRYVGERSLWLDIRIIAMTIGSVVRRQGIRQEGHETAARWGSIESTDTSERGSPPAPPGQRSDQTQVRQ